MEGDLNAERGLRALESRAVRPVGADRERDVNVRVLAATSRNLGALVQSGEFRKDLYYRLAEYVVTLPALRDRPEDVPMLARAVLESIDPAARLTDGALQALAAHPLPGNVRELRNVLKRAHALAAGKPLSAESLGLGGSLVTLRPDAPTPPPRGGSKPVAFPERITQLSRDIWRLGNVIEPAANNRYEARAQIRAALVHLRLQFPLAAWPRLSRDSTGGSSGRGGRRGKAAGGCATCCRRSGTTGGTRR